MFVISSHELLRTEYHSSRSYISFLDSKSWRWVETRRNGSRCNMSQYNMNLSYYHQIGSMNRLALFRVRGVRYMPFYVLMILYTVHNRPMVRIPQCTGRISHKAPICNRNVHTCAYFCYKVVGAVSYSDVVISAMSSQSTGVAIVYSTACSGADQRKYQSSTSLAFVRGITGDWWIPHTMCQQRGKCFHLMTPSCVLPASCAILNVCVLIL